MSPAFPRAFQGYINLHCTWKRFRDISGKPKHSIFHVVRFPLISQKRFHVQWRSIYPQTRLGKAVDIGYFNFRSVPFSMDKNAKNGTCNVFYVSFSCWSRLYSSLGPFSPELRAHCEASHVIYHGKWDRLEIKPAYVSRCLNTFPGMKAFSRY